MVVDQISKVFLTRTAPDVMGSGISQNATNNALA